MAHYILNFGMLWMCRDLTVPVCYSFVAIGSVNQQFLNQLTLALCKSSTSKICQPIQ